MSAPIVTRVHGHLESIGCVTYRVEGGDIRADWAAYHAARYAHEAPWCEISIWHGGHCLGSYGGSVWPTAWPELFRDLQRTAHGGGIELTEVGIAAIAAASACCAAGVEL